MRLDLVKILKRTRKNKHPPLLPIFIFNLTSINIRHEYLLHSVILPHVSSKSGYKEERESGVGRLRKNDENNLNINVTAHSFDCEVASLGFGITSRGKKLKPKIKGIDRGRG